MTPLDIAQLVVGGLARQTTGPFTTVPEQLYIGTLTNSTTTLYAAPSANTVANEVGLGPRVRIKSILITNLLNAGHTVSLHLVPPSGSASGANAILYTFAVTANNSQYITGIDAILPAGGTIQGAADAGSAITLCISGEVLYTP